jgi:hypothetical protein
MQILRVHYKTAREKGQEMPEITNRFLNIDIRSELLNAM